MEEIKGHKGLFITKEGKVFSNRRGKLKELKGYIANGYRKTWRQL